MTLLLTLKEAADQLRVSKRTVQRLIRAGHLPAKHIGRRTLVEPAAVEEYVRRAA